MQTQRVAIGVDIGGTKIESALVNDAGQIYYKKRSATDPYRDVHVIVDEIAEILSELAKETTLQPVGIGVGMAGQVEAESGVVRFAPNLGWRNVPLQKLLQDTLHLPVRVTGDVRATLWGEYLFGAGRGCQNVACLCVGTGVGGGMICGGQLVEGQSYTAGEFGHMTIDLHGRKCKCGNYGCLESIAGGWAIALRAQEAIQQNAEMGESLLKLAGGDIRNVTAETVALAAHAQDPLAIELMEVTVEAIVAGVVSVINILNPGRLLLGGGLFQGQPQLVEHIAESVFQRALGAACTDLQILPLQLGAHAPVIGAASWILHSK